MNNQKVDFLGRVVRVSRAPGRDALFPNWISQRAAMDGRTGKADAVNVNGSVHVSIDGEGLWAWFHPDELRPRMPIVSSDLLNVCLSLRMAHNGSADPIDAEEAALVLAYLRQRLAEWKPSIPSSGARFDECVRQLVLATIAEVETA